MKITERAMRHLAARHGMKISKSRQQEHLNNKGGYRLIDVRTNTIENGVDFELTLSEIYNWLTRKAMGATVGSK